MSVFLIGIGFWDKIDSQKDEFTTATTQRPADYMKRYQGTGLNL